VANVLQTKVDAQCDKLVTELSWQRAQCSTFSNYSKLFVESHQLNLPHLHLMPPLWVTPFEFCRDLRHHKMSPWAIMLHCLRDRTFSCFSRMPTWTDRQTDRQTDRHTAITYTAIAW